MFHFLYKYEHAVGARGWQFDRDYNKGYCNCILIILIKGATILNIVLLQILLILQQYLCLKDRSLLLINLLVVVYLLVQLFLFSVGFQCDELIDNFNNIHQILYYCIFLWLTIIVWCDSRLCRIILFFMKSVLISNRC